MVAGSSKRGCLPDRSCVAAPVRYAVRMELSPPSSTARILGIDPGLQVSGYAVLDTSSGMPRVREAGVVRSAEGRDTTDLAQRLRHLYDGIVERRS